MHSPLISVILPAYNAEQYIAEAVQSILDQTFKDFELIIINDASTDRTLEILNSFTDKRIRLINNETNQKVVKCLNKGLDLATGDFIARMDADDISLPQRFEKQVEYFNHHAEVDICATWVFVFGNKNHIQFMATDHDGIKASLLFQNIIIHPSIMFRKASLNSLSLRYDEAFVNAEDYGMWSQVIDKLKFGVVPEFLLKYRIHDSNVSVHKESNWEVIKRMNYKVYENLLQKTGVSYNAEELALHIKIGFRITGDITVFQFKKYLKWLEKIVCSNRQANYINRSRLFNEVMEHIILLSRKVKRSPAFFFTICKTFLKIFSMQDFIRYIPFKKNKSAVYNKGMALLNSINPSS